MNACCYIMCNTCTCAHGITFGLVFLYILPIYKMKEGLFYKVESEWLTLTLKGLVVEKTAAETIEGSS